MSGQMEFRRRIESAVLDTVLQQSGMDLPTAEITRIREQASLWDFYEGFHWQGASNPDGNEVTRNYARKVVNKFLAYEIGKGFTIKLHKDVETYILPFLNCVLEQMNDMQKIFTEIGQDKNATGDAWLYVRDVLPTDTGEYSDPYKEYPNGYIKLIPYAGRHCFPTYDRNDPDKLIRMDIVYVEEDMSPFKGQGGKKQIVTRYSYTADTVKVYKGDKLSNTYANRTGIIPFFRIRNIPMLGKLRSMSDIEDVMPVNIELNVNNSNVADVIEYHSAPTTLIFGAKLKDIEKSANTTISGLPENARVEHLALETDLPAANHYIDKARLALFEMASIPEMAFGGDMAISNTSSVALSVAFGPMLEVIQMKQNGWDVFLRGALKYIIHLGITTGMLEPYLNEGDAVGDTIPRMASIDELVEKFKSLVYRVEILFEEVLPKDILVELQRIQLEMKLGLCNREMALKRLGRKNIAQLLADIDKDRETNPEIYSIATQLDIELLRAQIEQALAAAEGVETDDEATGAGITRKGGKDIMKRKIGTNKEGKDSEVNAGFQNGPEEK